VDFNTDQVASRLVSWFPSDGSGGPQRLRRSWRPLAAVATGLAAVMVAMPVTASAGPIAVFPHQDGSFLSHLSTLTVGPSTVPATGDVNPYGVAVVPYSIGRLGAGSTLVSNFNNSSNAQGTGTTIVEVSPHGTQHLFAQINPASLPGPCPGGIGLTTALSILPGGWVVVGSLPTTDGTAATAGAGCLLVLDSQGRVRETWSGGGINGPWDMTAVSAGNVASLFVTNVLNGTVAADGGNPSQSPGNVVDSGTVLRIDVFFSPFRPPSIVSRTVVADGFGERTDPVALVVGPTGDALAGDGTLYVADTIGNRIAAIPNALWRLTPVHGGGTTVSVGGSLNGPLGMTIAPNGHILTVNGGDGNIVETTPGGTQLPAVQLDGSGNPPGAGALFGLAIAPFAEGVLFVDDATNNLDLLH
jgi:hypothetical protein